MKLRVFFAAPLLFGSSAAFATQSYSCRTTAPAGVTMSVVIGTLGVAGATLREGESALSTFGGTPGLVIGQSWVDERSLLLDLLGPDHDRRVARLTVSVGGTLDSRFLNGWLEYGGRRSRIVCSAA